MKIIKNLALITLISGTALFNNAYGMNYTIDRALAAKNRKNLSEDEQNNLNWQLKDLCSKIFIKLDTLKQCLQKGANPNSPCNALNGRRPLQLVADSFDALDATRLLLNAGADPHLKDDEDQTVLHFLAWYCNNARNGALVKLYLYMGVTSNLKDREGATALDRALLRDPNSETAQLLLFANNYLKEGLPILNNQTMQYAPIVFSIACAHKKVIDMPILFDQCNEERQIIIKTPDFDYYIDFSKISNKIDSLEELYFLENKYKGSNKKTTSGFALKNNAYALVALQKSPFADLLIVTQK